MIEINETTRFDCIKVGDKNIQGEFRLEAPTGELAGSVGLFVVEEATARCWPIGQVVGLRAIVADTEEGE